MNICWVFIRASDWLCCINVVSANKRPEKLRTLVPELTPLYRWSDWGLEASNDLSKGKQLVNGEDCGQTLGFPDSRTYVLNIHGKDWCWSWNSNTLATWCEELTHLKRPWCWERLKAGREGDNRGWNVCWPTRWAWVWVNSGSWWWTRRPGLLRSMGLQRVGHDWVIELTELGTYAVNCFWSLNTGNKFL